ncbi:hypothetical protein BKA82DRAFT_31474 [Pisolithus tinctorius]|uniref:Uncharacterized protein n=1 Tax=Pisolithus tinctorius Marx 270 TaxID=870435 RepID=A0A0C3NSS2_PISTI|nr:hypothetical protein BKA82DRAFT_31474 [Pisolithus tinctorius]KIN98303.1 hypothetical protein M404DRAFT_31474 [Pisolithus tinctorius Marx 270]
MSCIGSSCNTSSEFTPQEMKELFICGVKPLPDNILTNMVMEKYANSERSHHQLILATWHLKGMKHRVQTLDQVQNHLEENQLLSEDELEFWLGMYSDHGLPQLQEDELFYGWLMNHEAHLHRSKDEELMLLEKELDAHGFAKGVGCAANGKGHSKQGKSKAGSDSESQAM